MDKRIIFTKEPWWGIITDKVKLPLEIVLIGIDKVLPEITKETVKHPNAKLLVEVQDYILEHLNLWKHYHGLKRAMFRGLFKLVIVIYASDTPYRGLIDIVIEELVKRQDRWVPRPLNEPDDRIWKHDNIEGLPKPENKEPLSSADYLAKEEKIKCL